MINRGSTWHQQYDCWLDYYSTRSHTGIATYQITTLFRFVYNHFVLFVSLSASESSIHPLQPLSLSTETLSVPNRGSGTQSGTQRYHFDLHRRKIGLNIALSMTIDAALCIMPKLLRPSWCAVALIVVVWPKSMDYINKEWVFHDGPNASYEWLMEVVYWKDCTI